MWLLAQWLVNITYCPDIRTMYTRINVKHFLIRPCTAKICALLKNLIYSTYLERWMHNYKILFLRFCQIMLKKLDGCDRIFSCFSSSGISFCKSRWSDYELRDMLVHLVNRAVTGPGNRIYRHFLNLISPETDLLQPRKFSLSRLQRITFSRRINYTW